MAKPAARSGLSGGVFRCYAGQNPRRGPGQEQGRVCGASAHSDGEKNVLGLWIEQAEGAKFWLKVVNELKRAASTTS